MKYLKKVSVLALTTVAISTSLFAQSTTPVDPRVTKQPSVTAEKRSIDAGQLSAAYLKEARVAADLGNIQRAVNLYSTAESYGQKEGLEVNFPGERPDIKGESLMVQHRYADAIPYLQRVHGPTFEAWLVIAYCRTGQLEEAKHALQTLPSTLGTGMEPEATLKELPTRSGTTLRTIEATALLFESDQIEAQGRLKLAAEIVNQADQLSPGNGVTLLHLGSVYCLDHQYDKALQVLTRAKGLLDENEKATWVKRKIEDIQWKLSQSQGLEKPVPAS